LSFDDGIINVTTNHQLSLTQIIDWLKLISNLSQTSLIDFIFLIDRLKTKKELKPAQRKTRAKPHLWAASPVQRF
jgi:hypothetical protein